MSESVRSLDHPGADHRRKLDSPTGWTCRPYQSHRLSCILTREWFNCVRRVRQDDHNLGLHYRDRTVQIRRRKGPHMYYLFTKWQVSCLCVPNFGNDKSNRVCKRKGSPYTIASLDIAKFFKAHQLRSRLFTSKRQDISINFVWLQTSNLGRRKRTRTSYSRRFNVRLLLLRNPCLFLTQRCICIDSLQVRFSCYMEYGETRVYEPVGVPSLGQIYRNISGWKDHGSNLWRR